ncbi:hypothetical protein PIB30_028824 [Stylosanthes scabra]|uniref:Uncharacterized protein n=1 Tax=Stylosanthes scabra TaxID=79078 RepID=A0ABU6TD16_9FABA|nr:hypothetical protein [Stylosanthes scabra]
MDATRQSTPLEKTRLGNRFKDSNRFAFSSTFHKTASTIKAVPFIKTTTSSFSKKTKNKNNKREKKTIEAELTLIITWKRNSSTKTRTSTHYSEPRRTSKHCSSLRNEKGGTQTKSETLQTIKKTKGHHFRCLPKTVATMYNECLRKNVEKMALIEELGFGAFSHLPDYNLKQHMLKELVNIYDIHDNKIHSVRGDVQITTEKIGKALGLSWNGAPFDERVSEKDLNDEDYAIFKMFQGKSQADLMMLVKSTPVDTEANQNLFKRTFLIFIQKVFLLATSSPNVTPKALPTLFGLENTRDRNWALHVHDFLLDEDSRESEAQPPWIQYWTGENLRNRLHREQNHSTGLVQTGLLRAAKEKLQKRNMDLKMGLNLRRREPSSSSESESEFDSEEEYESEVESNAGGASTKLDSENTMSEELVERRPLSKPNPAQQEKRSKKKHESNATGGARSDDRPLVDSIRRPAPIMHQETAALGKRKQPDRAEKGKKT